MHPPFDLSDEYNNMNNFDNMINIPLHMGVFELHGSICGFHSSISVYPVQERNPPFFLKFLLKFECMFYLLESSNSNK